MDYKPQQNKKPWTQRSLELDEFSTLLQNRPLFQAICPGSLWARDNSWLLSRVQRLAGPAGGQGPFVPFGSTNRDKRGAFCPGWWIKPGQKARVAFCPGWCLQPGHKALGPLSPSLSPRLSHSLVFLLFLARDRGVLISSPHLWISLIPRPSIGAKGLGLVFLFFLGLYSSIHALEIEKMCS